jgi:tetratricopeptide (TPR) repeat protein
MRFPEAKAVYETAIRKAPHHGMAQQHLSSLARQQGNIKESEHYLSEAIERNPALPFAYLERAYYRSEAGNYIGAIEDYTAALNIDSLDEEVLINRGLAFEKTGELNAAYIDFTHAINLNEASQHAWLCRANILAKQLKFEEAIEDYGIAILYDPVYPLAFYNSALVRYLIGEKSAACEDLKKAEELGQTIPENIKSAICERGS